MQNIFFKWYTQDGDFFSGTVEIHNNATLEEIKQEIINFVNEEYGDKYYANKIEILLD